MTAFHFIVFQWPLNRKEALIGAFDQVRTKQLILKQNFLRFSLEYRHFIYLHKYPWFAIVSHLNYLKVPEFESQSQVSPRKTSQYYLSPENFKRLKPRSIQLNLVIMSF